MEAGQEAPACPLEAVGRPEAVEGRADALRLLAAFLAVPWGTLVGLPAVAAQAQEVP